jgi:hypothetical protein
MIEKLVEITIDPVLLFSVLVFGVGFVVQIPIILDIMRAYRENKKESDVSAAK